MNVVVVIGAGSIGQAVARRVSAGRHVVLADLRDQNAEPAAKTKYRSVGHGFGLGVGTSAEGWIADAVRFWLKQIQQRAHADRATAPVGGQR